MGIVLFHLYICVFHNHSNASRNKGNPSSFGSAIQKLSSDYLKVVSTTFLLVCFVCLKESTCETRKNVFYFSLKGLSVLEIIKFQLFRYSNIMSSKSQS